MRDGCASCRFRVNVVKRGHAPLEEGLVFLQSVECSCVEIIRSSVRFVHCEFAALTSPGEKVISLESFRHFRKFQLVSFQKCKQNKNHTTQLHSFEKHASLIT